MYLVENVNGGKVVPTADYWSLKETDLFIFCQKINNSPYRPDVQLPA